VQTSDEKSLFLVVSVALGALGFDAYCAVWAAIIYLLIRTQRTSKPEHAHDPPGEPNVAANPSLTSPDLFNVICSGVLSLIGLHLVTSFHLASLASSGWDVPFYYKLLMRIVSLTGAFVLASYVLSRSGKMRLIVALAFNLVGNAGASVFTIPVFLGFWVWFFK